MLIRTTMVLSALVFVLTPSSDIHARGFGGFSGGRSFSGGGSRSFSSGSFGGYHSSEFSGSHYGSWNAGGRSLNYSGSHSTSAASGYRGWGGTSSYDHTASGSHGGSISTEGTRGAAMSPWGGVTGGSRTTTATGPGGRTYDSSSEHGAAWNRYGAAAGGSRSTSATGLNGRSYSGSSERGVAVGPYGRTVGGAEHTGTAMGPAGSATRSWQSSFSGYHFPTDFGLSHYSSFNSAAMGHSTAYWSASATTARAGYARSNFGYYNAFRPAWYTAHPGCWYAAGWTAASAWETATQPVLANFVSIPSQPIYYDYGNNIVYHDNSVYVDGHDTGAAQTYAQQATAIADQGQSAAAPADQEWKALGIFALVASEEKNSNNIFQLAVNKDGIIRGNYYDGLMDTTTPVFGSVDKKSQRAAWTIGKKKDRVFEAGVFNLTKDETPVLVHFGLDRTQQWLLVRMPKN